MKDIVDNNSVVLGISRDSVKSHINFSQKMNLPFLLLSDNEGIVCNLYGVLKEKTMYGKKSLGIDRSTFIINQEGIIEKIFRKIKVDGHIEKVINSIKS